MLPILLSSMHAGKEYIMRSRLFALGLFSVAMIHPALARQFELTAASGDGPPAVAMPGGSDQGPMPLPGPMRHGQGGFGSHRMGPPPEFMLAARLAAIEARIGVRTEQIDAWRDYTGALQAVLAPSRPNHGLGGSGEREPDAGVAGAESNADVPDPFAFQDRLADDLTKRAASAGKLKDAIAALRTRLTPEQLEILASAERPQGPPPGPWDNPPDDAAGPRGLPSPGRQLPPPQPRIGEQL